MQFRYLFLKDTILVAGIDEYEKTRGFFVNVTGSIFLFKTVVNLYFQLIQ